MGKSWSELTKEEKEREKIRSRERMRRYRAEGRYGPDWARYHNESKKILEEDFQKNYTPYGIRKMCYMCGVEKENLRVHHINGDYTNNDLRNLAWCCHRCDSRQAWERKISMSRE